MHSNGMGITLDGKLTRLKWHRLRRSMADPEFGAAVMTDGFRLGASMELDLRLRGDGGFAVLHDDRLDRETSGTGPVSARDRAEMAALTYRQSGLPLILSEDLAGMLSTAHPDALLQFDMKDDLAVVGARGVAHLAAHFGALTAPIIFSGGCPYLIRALGDALPDVPRGIDPTDRLIDITQTDGLAAAETALIAELRSGTAPDTCYLNWEMILGAGDRGLDLVALCQAEGVKVDAWTYNLAAPVTGFSNSEAAQFGALMALGPDQITTDEAVATEAAWNALMLRAEPHV